MTLCHLTNILLITFHMPGFAFYTVVTNQGSYNSRSCCEQFFCTAVQRMQVLENDPTLGELWMYSRLTVLFYVICGGKDDTLKKKKPENSLAMKNIFKQNQSALITWGKYLSSFFSLPGYHRVHYFHFQPSMTFTQEK